jgi:hypothetical protein
MTAQDAPAAFKLFIQQGAEPLVGGGAERSFPKVFAVNRR